MSHKSFSPGQSPERLRRTPFDAGGTAPPATPRGDKIPLGSGGPTTPKEKAGHEDTYLYYQGGNFPLKTPPKYTENRLQN